MEKDYSFVYIWIGNFETQSDFEDYISIENAYKNETMPLSKFCEDIGIDYYDEDFQEFGFMEQMVDKEKILSGYSWSKSYNYEFQNNLKKLNISKFNSIFLIFHHYSLENYKGHVEKDSKIKFVGKFNVDIEENSLE